MTAKKLQVLKIEMSVNAVSSIPDHIQREFGSIFQGVGTLKDRQVKLHVDPNIEPTAQPLRRRPYQLRSKVEDRVKELLNYDIIEPVESASGSVNPVIIVPKAHGEIGLCINMRVPMKPFSRFVIQSQQWTRFYKA